MIEKQYQELYNLVQLILGHLDCGNHIFPESLPHEEIRTILAKVERDTTGSWEEMLNDATSHTEN